MDDQSRELLDRVRAVIAERDALRADVGQMHNLLNSWRARATRIEAERDALRALPVIDRCSLCSWAHRDTPTDGVCTHPDTLPRRAPIDPTKPPIDACPMRGGAR